MKDKINIVWLKRDLRTFDHEPLYEAEKLGTNYIIIYLFEPSIINQADFSQRHQQFIYHSILCMNETLKKYNREVYIFNADAKDVFELLISKYEINKLLSYQETGTLSSWKRDKKVNEILKSNNINWLEFENQGVIRGSRNRNGWDKHWFSYVNSSIIENSFSYNNFNIKINEYIFQIKNFPQLKKYPNKFQPAGQKYALKYLNSFVSDRAKFYNYNISKPELSRVSCSRLSPYLAWGNISVRYIYKHIISSSSYKKNKGQFTGFLSRLKWRSHFIQKFEVDCSYEFECVNRGYEQMTYTNDDNFLEKWKKGQTGFPMVDASMRCLIENGWLNFRMRAMLVSFLCHSLEQDWRRGVYHLAGLFLDYEPGIHYTQFQMQAGVTGVNSIRVYNPIKQSKEKDSDARFLKKWLPELSTLEIPFVHEPWNLTEIDLIQKSIPTYYKKPIISTDLSRSKVTRKLWELRKDDLVKKESKRILAVHVRTNSKQNEI